MQALEIVMLGASVLKNGSPRWQTAVPVGNDNDDVESWGEVAVYQGLGLTSLPEPKDSTGCAEAVIATSVGNKNAVVIGGRDTRDADIVGKLDPGDTVLHATGKGRKPQLQLKKKKRAAAFVVPCADGTDIVATLDGKNHRVQILAWGQVIQLTKKDGILLKGNGKGGIVISGDDVAIMGNFRLPGMPPGMYLMASTIAGQLAGAAGAQATAQLMAVKGVGGTT